MILQTPASAFFMYRCPDVWGIVIHKQTLRTAVLFDHFLSQERGISCVILGGDVFELQPLGEGVKLNQKILLSAIRNAEMPCILGNKLKELLRFDGKQASNELPHDKLSTLPTFEEHIFKSSSSILTTSNDPKRPGEN